MKSFRNKLFMVLVLFLILILSCISFAQESKKVTINISSVYPENCPTDEALSKFRQLVTERSDGRIEVFIHKAEAMGNERQTTEMLIAGSVEYGAIGDGDIIYYFPEYQLQETPYLFGSQDDFWKYWSGAPGKKMESIIEEKLDIRTAGIIYRGARYLTANKPIKSVADVKGLKLRLPPDEVWFKVWEALGALPTEVSFGELYLALKTGVVEAQENPPETILGYKFYEAQKYMMPTEHVHSSARILFSVKWWETLNKDDQDLLTRAMEESIVFANKIAKEGDAQFVEKLQELGMILVSVDKNEFKEIVDPVIEEISKERWDPEFYKLVKDTLK